MADEPQKSSLPLQAHDAALAAARSDGGAPEAEQNAASVGAAAVHVDGAPTIRAAPTAELAKVAAAPTTDEGTKGAPTGGDGADERLTAIEMAIKTGVERMLAAFEAKLAYDASKQLQIDRLHEELLQYRTDQMARAARPLVHGMIRLHDDIGKLLSALRAKPADALSPERFFSLLEGLQEDVEIVLGQNGVAAYREPGGPFDPRRQRALKKVGTSENALAGTVAESIRPGFEQGTEILEKERVATYTFDPRPAESPGAASREAPEGDVSSSEPQQKSGRPAE